MKKLLQTTLLIGILSVGLSPVSFAQDIDANRMNRDIRIMENILGELFKTHNPNIRTTSATTYFMSEGTWGYSGSRPVRGTYLPGYGLIFNINSGNQFVVITGNTPTPTAKFYYDSDGSESDGEQEVTIESVEARIAEFLKDYGSTVGQLKGDDRIMVIYGSPKSQRNVYRIMEDQMDRNAEKPETLPVISVSAKVSDLTDYRRGRLNDNQFADRLQTATSEGKEYLDLKVLSNIFETALREQESPAFRLMGGVDYLMLDNFGALYSFDVRYTSRRNSPNAFAFEILERARGAVSVTSERADALEEREELIEEIAKAYDSLVSNIKEYVVDYGRTLSSVGSDQYVLLSVSINGRFEDIPGRVEVQVKKSTLDQLDQGRINREQALAQVIVTEY